MVDCAYCQKPLTCETCQADYEPTSREAYEAFMRPEVSVICPNCEAILVCHWCKTPYDGTSQDEADD